MFFSDPSQWWDNRLTKKSSTQPDFKHKTTLEALWIDSWLNPPWVREKIATIASDVVQFSRGRTSRVPACYEDDGEVKKFSKEGRFKEALHLVQLMVQQTSEAPKGAFVCLLRACARRKALAEGKQVHALVIQSKSDSEILLANLLIEMYSKCGSIEDAREVFAAMCQHNLSSWTAIISAYARTGQYKEAVALFQQMQHTGIEPDKVACVVMLKAYANMVALEQGRQLHSLIVQKGFYTDLIVQTSLVGMYAKCGCLKDARELFNNMSKRDVISWNAIIGGYAQKGLVKEAFDLYLQMKHEGIQPDIATYVLLLKACASISALEQGKQLHSLILRRGLHTEVIIQNSLVGMYAKCGCLKDAHKLFNTMTERDVVSWNAIIAGYAHKGLGKEALDLYEQMKHEGERPDIATLLVLLKACASISALDQGKQLHSLIIERGLGSKITIQTTLVYMYAKCGCLKDAHELFNSMAERNVVSWNALISAYAQNGLGEEALDLYNQMRTEGMEPNSTTLVLMLKACASILSLEQGKQLHSLILERGLEVEVIVQTALVDMYVKCGCLKDARDIFENMTEHNVVSWNAMISGYTQKGLGKEALDLHTQMKHEGIQPDITTFALVLKACASISALEQGKELHILILERGLQSQVIIQNTLVDMYMKCGCFNDAHELFNNMTDRNVVSWNVMIAGYAQNGLGKEALDLYRQMKHEGIQANEVTFISVLSACSRSGLVDEGRHVFEMMSKDHGVTPTLAHYGCMVDLLGRAGCLADAENLILKMPIKPSKPLWMSLLGAARKFVNAEIGKRAFNWAVKLEPKGAAPYLVLIDIYYATGKMDEAAQIRKDMEDNCSSEMLVQLG